MSKTITKEIEKAEIRPWGSFTVIEEGKNYKVKRLVMNPGQRFSLQYHLKRNEHWVVVEGEARAIRNEDVLLLKPDDSLYLPIGTIHRLENPFEKPLVIIEVQCGEYLGEDDIVRIDDDYDRV